MPGSRMFRQFIVVLRESYKKGPKDISLGTFFKEADLQQAGGKSAVRGILGYFLTEKKSELSRAKLEKTAFWRPL
jgi:hypothetical protein